MIFISKHRWILFLIFWLFGGHEWIPVQHAQNLPFYTTNSFFLQDRFPICSPTVPNIHRLKSFSHQIFQIFPKYSSFKKFQSRAQQLQSISSQFWPAMAEGKIRFPWSFCCGCCCCRLCCCSCCCCCCCCWFSQSMAEGKIRFPRSYSVSDGGIELLWQALQKCVWQKFCQQVW